MLRMAVTGEQHHYQINPHHPPHYTQHTRDTTLHTAHTRHTTLHTAHTRLTTLHTAHTRHTTLHTHETPPTTQHTHHPPHTNTCVYTLITSRDLKRLVLRECALVHLVQMCLHARRTTKGVTVVCVTSHRRVSLPQIHRQYPVGS